MQSVTRIVGAALILCTACPMASAEDFTGPGGVIPEPTGGRPGVFTSDVNVATGGTVTGIAVSLNGIVHTWVGDLTVTVEHLPTGTSATLFSRVGKTSASTGVGDSSNLAGDYVFFDGAPGDLWMAAASGDTGFDIPSGSYFPSEPLTGLPSPIDPVFIGLNASGTWRLTITDKGLQDIGSIDTWTLSLEIDGATCPAQCFGDINGDGIVDGADLGELLGAWGSNNPCIDLNGSGDVDGADLGLLLGAWGVCE